MVTLKDVAQRAGVSIRTVSNVVNDWPYIRPELRARVQAVIDELGYQPNVAARNLRKGRSGLIALVVPEVDVPYFGELTRCIVDEASARGMTVVIEQTDGVLDRERDLMARNTGAMLVDGIIFSPVSMSSAEIAARDARNPLVLLGENEGGEADHVLIDNEQAAMDATDHLLDLGRTRIGLIGRNPPGHPRTAELRVKGFLRSLERADVTASPQLQPDTAGFHRADGAEAARALLELAEPPDAIFCLSDLLALGAIRELVSAGVRVPEDIAVIGIDDIEDGRYSNPSLSTIAPDKVGLARDAVSLLCDRLEDGGAPPKMQTVPHALVVRESTAGASR